MSFIQKIPANKEEQIFVFEAYYASTLEHLHALMSSKNIKVDNHICLGFYLRDVLNRHDLFEIFNSCRLKRNMLLYYGNAQETENFYVLIDSLVYLMGQVEQIMIRELKKQN